MARRSKTLDELATLRERVVAANMRRRDAEQAQTDAQAQLRRLHDERVNALADEDEARAGKIASAIADLGRRVDGDLGQRLEGAALAARRAEAEVARFRAANFERIEAERAPAGEALTARYEEALRALVDVDRAWHAHQAESISNAAAAPGVDVRRVQDINAGDVARDARRVLARGPLNRPTLAGGPHGVHIAPVDDPDPEIREAARAAVIAQDAARAGGRRG